MKIKIRLFLFLIASVLFFAVGILLGYSYPNKMKQVATKPFRTQPSLTTISSNLLKAYLSQQQWSKAIESSQWVLSRSEYQEIYPQALYTLALSYYQQNDFALCQEYLERLEGMLLNHTVWHDQGKELKKLFEKK